MTNSKTFLRLSVGMVAAGMMAISSAPAAQLLQFEPTPVSPGLPEFSWQGPGGNFVSANGSSNLDGDGNLPVNLQNPPGLEVDVPAIVAAPVNSGEVINGDTSSFYDVALSVTGLTDDGAYALYNPAINLAVQTLTTGTFTFTATNGAVLLTGTFDNNSISTPLSSTSAGFESGTVTYTGGLILSAFNGGSGSASVSMTLYSPADVTATGPTSGFLQEAPVTIGHFDADATGLFDINIIPEPASLSLLGLAGLMGLRRRR